MKLNEVKKSQWIKFSIVSLCCLLFAIWVGNYWLLIGLALVFDIYISKYIPWGAWKRSNNKSVMKIAEWVDAILFALIAVYFINLFIFQNYKIPTSSLEKTLLVGDYLFVSKLSYGPRVPNTPLSFPLAQHTMPILNCKSYIEWPQWAYHRLKGFGQVQRNDIVVFNFPAGDTVAVNRQNPDYYVLCDEFERERIHSDKETFGEIVYRPVDRRENYVKRCVGMPGDSLQIIQNSIYIDGKKQADPKNMQLNYFIETTGALWSEEQFRALDVSLDDRSLANSKSHAQQMFQYLEIQPNAGGNYNPVYHMPLTKAALEKIKQNKWARSIHVDPDFYRGSTYPGKSLETAWTRDNFGPLWIPQKGQTITLDQRNIALYSRCIVNYENNTMAIEGNNILINGVETKQYTFRYDYFFMMGDNRHNSQDSRYWGFVPEDHVVGKPILVWLSIDKDRNLFNGGIRWGRLFKWVSNE